MERGILAKLEKRAQKQGWGAGEVAHAGSLLFSP